MKSLLEFLKSISDETRIRILVLLSHKELCVCEICEILGLSQPQISRHLARLRDSGYVRDERQGQWVFYYTNFDNTAIKEVMETILRNIDEFPQLEIDIKRYQQKIKDGSLCSRRTL